MNKSDIYAVIAANNSQKRFNWYSFFAILVFGGGGLLLLAYLMGI